MDIFIGKWINEGRTVAAPGAPSVRILTSDVYEWAPGGFFVLHYAYGRIGTASGGGVEIIGYDATKKEYFSHFFDSQGNVVISRLSFRDGVWIWSGDWAGQGRAGQGRAGSSRHLQVQ